MKILNSFLNVINKTPTINSSYNGATIDIDGIAIGIAIINYIGNSQYNGYGIFFFSRNYGGDICEKISANNTNATINNTTISPILLDNKN